MYDWLLPESLPTRFLAHIRRTGLVRAGDRVAVAVSGGADSVAMLRLLHELRTELGILLSVAHFNHKIRGTASDQDQEFVRELATRLNLEFHIGQGDVPGLADSAHLGLEAAARKMRYRFFEQLLEGGLATRIATAHTLDDQAETVLLKFLRGAWTQGLAGIYPRFSMSKGEVVRPLLQFRRSDLRKYLDGAGQQWHEDATNLDLHHARNRARQVLLPLIEREFNPGIAETLASVSEIARAEQDYWQSVLPPSKQSGEIGFELLDRLPLAARRRVLRSVAKGVGLALEFREVEQILGMLDSAGAARLELPDGWVAERVFHDFGKEMYEPTGDLSVATVKRRVLRFRRAVASGDYEYRLPIPGEVGVPELGAIVQARVVESDSDQCTLDMVALGSELTIRNWRPGDRFRPAHTSRPKKIKELLQERHISGSERACWPVAVASGEIVWVKGFAIPDHLRALSKGVRIAIMTNAGS